MVKRILPIALVGFIVLSLGACADREEQFQKGLKAYNIQNYEIALKYLTPAANKGHARAQEVLGYIYARGYGVEKNDKLAFEWMKKSAENGNGLAQWVVADMLLNGQGVEKSEAEVLQWIRKAAQKDIAEAKRFLEYYEEHHEIPFWATSASE